MKKRKEISRTAAVLLTGVQHGSAKTAFCSTPNGKFARLNKSGEEINKVTVRGNGWKTAIKTHVVFPMPGLERSGGSRFLTISTQHKASTRTCHQKLD